jgi:hypothetical protein
VFSTELISQKQAFFIYSPTPKNSPVPPVFLADGDIDLSFPFFPLSFLATFFNRFLERKTGGGGFLIKPRRRLSSVRRFQCFAVGCDDRIVVGVVAGPAIKVFQLF